MMWWRDQPFTLGGNGRAHLEVKGLSAGYAGFLVLRDLRLEARPGLTIGKNLESLPDFSAPTKPEKKSRRRRSARCAPGFSRAA